MNRLIFLLCALLACPVSVSGQDDGIRVEALPQQKLPVRPGQYSGIAYTGGDRYAVVDDKLPGGGIVFFELPLREDGRVRTSRIRRVVPEGTRSAGSPALDNEGVVWADGKLYVAAEGDQSIREYDLDGYPTGVSFPVPEDMGVEAIVKNGGFEAFSWNAATGRFWTTTEFPLKTDGKASRLHRIQCFDAGHQACGRWLYQMDEPVAESGQGAVMAYVHGISAMAALDDGRLIILEREVFVPAGVPRLILDRSFTKTKLYIVNPAAGYDGILPKQLLCEFETRLSLNAAGVDVALANYEGMCLGPRLPDGRQTLILLADSQSGMASLARRIGRKRITLEIIKVLLLGGPCD